MNCRFQQRLYDQIQDIEYVLHQAESAISNIIWDNYRPYNQLSIILENAIEFVVRSQVHTRIRAHVLK
jgi:hypothetical protein